MTEYVENQLVEALENVESPINYRGRDENVQVKTKIIERS